jgi:hypothetical protein
MDRVSPQSTDAERREAQERLRREVAEANRQSSVATATDPRRGGGRQ